MRSALAGVLLVAGIVIAIVASGGGGGTEHGSAPPTTTTSATIPTANTGLPSLHGAGLQRGNPVKLPSTPAGLAADGRRVWAIAPGRLFELGAGGAHPLLTFDGQPTNVAVDARGRVWMTGVGATGVTVFDPNTAQRTTVQAGEAPNLIATSDNAVWLARRGGSAVTRISLGADSTQTTPVEQPIAALGDANGRLWIAPINGAVTVLNNDGTRSDVAGPAIAPDTVGIASSNGVWFLSSSLTRVDPRKQFATGGAYAAHSYQAPVGRGPAGIGALAHDNSIWVLTQGDKTLRRIATDGPDDNRVIARVVFPGTPGGLAVGDHVLWVDVPATKMIYPISF